MENDKKKYELDTTENRRFAEFLREDLLSFGHGFASPEGGAYYLGDDGTPWRDRPRETWITCRMAHVYSIGEMLGHKGSRQLVDSALKGLRGELHDDKNGGWYAGINADGSIIPGKQCYAHAFVILAACSASLIHAEGADELLKEALDTYDRFFWEEEKGLAVDTWDTGFNELSDYRGVNANMHTVEAFLAAFDTLHEEKYRARAGRIIDHVIGWAEKNRWRIPEHFSKEWKADLMLNRDRPDDPFKPFGATPGHGIEWARLITQYALSAFSSDMKQIEAYVGYARKLYDRAVEDGWAADGAPGICYTTDWKGKPVVHDRMHWTLAEAINTSAVLYRVTAAEKYARDYAMFMEYLDEMVLDHQNGSWFHQLDQNNQVIGTVWPGKSDLYHALQATLIPYNKDIGLSIAQTCKK
ncbi:MAG: AGE family epimerase/isomerase [Lachnospiraceae bacterium]|nr:AGE family epimerase/isomerase [Lachnospiraceae bacterium]